MLLMASVSVFENLSKFLLLGLPYEPGCKSSANIVEGLASRKLAVDFGLIVLPKNFSPEGDLGGV